MPTTKKRVEPIEIVHPNAAGLDIGAREIYACVPPDRAGETIKVFGTCTPDLAQLADWFVAQQVDTVAMESTGVYWIPVFDLLEARGLKLSLVNGRHVKHVPGRKSDVHDCQWLQKLHALGLLAGSFRPDGARCALRAYLRHRADRVQHRAAHVQHMQKAMQQMNLLLPEVVADITGETGMTIVRAIVAGERDSVKLAQFRNARCTSSEDTMAKALTGTWKEEHLFALTQALALYDFYTEQVAACDAQIERHDVAMKPRWESPTSDSPCRSPVQRRKKRKNEPAFDVRASIMRLTGVDLAAVDGLGPTLAQRILSEIGTDMSKWATDITYIRLRQGWLYLVVVVDWYARYIVSWEVDQTLQQPFVTAAVPRALTTATPHIGNSDQGSHFTSLQYTALLQAACVQISMDGRGRALDTVFTERLWHTVTYEEVSLNEYASPREARCRLGHYLTFYNHQRVHQALGYQTPAEVYYQKGTEAPLNRRSSVS